MRRLAALMAAGTLLLSACGGDRSAERAADQPAGAGKRLSIATGNTTGVYYVLGGGLADQIGRHVPGYQATAEATGASVENIQRVVRGDSDIAFTLADSAADAVAGKGAFTGPQPIRALARLYDNSTQVVAAADAGVKSVADLKGKRVSTGSPNSGTEVIALRLLEAAGLDPDEDVTRQSLGLPESVQGIKDGTLDALVWSGGLPTPGITDLFTSLKDEVAFVPLDASLPKMQAEHGPVYAQGVIGKDVYGTPADVPTIVVPNLLVVNERMDPALAESLTRLLFDRRADLEKVHPSARGITREKAPETDPVPLHDGAKKYYGR
ncbi:C4-dicarboxylate ABC transporter substrate-binding protein [Planomonospora parontospora subsp. parontospora]|uniref:C4-dicarboxylate ABC transporter substrate-binding protein n=2 Tax=Planomonospora parontospora TaxID=58119 RepID=A0AA37F8C5_9ACTN|nr:TAXI family TRAP transporter solute-binding subunit [Planomonospora parontospora]GGL00309.1 C4-dicarboxylate ABC transporter substrate-binding protein [Planomonospora parontospora]GII11128.1 C4-dicarboxylate ABC transporter substrate-binding protein [Planomonospora parontospora subsp. parontospora]